MTRLRIIAAAVLAALTITVAGGVVGHRPRSAPEIASVAIAPPADRLRASVARAQSKLQRVPGDWRTWAVLATSYVELSRTTSDSRYYSIAEEAIRRSVEIRPKGNVEAMVVSGALANARHDFETARTIARDAISLNEFHAEAYAVLADAETQLGNSAEATEAIQRLVDLRPGLPAYARASYDLELRGRNTQARDLMRRALAVAVDRHDIAFCRVQLGDLALAGGDLAEARSQYDAAFAADPNSLGAARGMARVAGAAGALDEAIRRYSALVERAPTPGHLLEYVELLRADGRLAEAVQQLRLAVAAHELFVASGGADGLIGAAIAVASGDPAGAVREAQAEWQRRQHPDVADALGWALHLANQDEKALEYALRAVAAGSRTATHHFHLGMIQFALGDRDGARVSLAAALKINPRFSVTDATTARWALGHLGSS